MKILGPVIAALVLMIALVPTGLSATSSGERNTATVCITYVNAGFGCATGSLGHILGACDGGGCTVTLTGNLAVTPVACGWMSWNDLRACAYDQPDTDDHRETAFFPPGTYTSKSDLCISDPTVTYAFPCEELRHTFVVPATGASVQNNAAIIIAGVFSILPDAPGVEDPGEDVLVYESPTFRVYHKVT